MTATKKQKKAVEPSTKKQMKSSLENPPSWDDLDAMIAWLKRFESLLEPSAKELEEWRKHPQECQELAEVLSEAIHKTNALIYELNRR